MFIYTQLTYVMFKLMNVFAFHKYTFIPNLMSVTCLKKVDAESIKHWDTVSEASTVSSVS